MALARYLFVYYMRSYRFLAPTLAFAGGIMFVYSEIPNPVLDSYAQTSMWLFAASAWLAYGYINLEHESQRLVTVLYARSVTYYYAVKLLLLGAIGAALALFATAYPIVFRAFDRTPTAGEALTAWLSHAIAAGLGIACALFFADKRTSEKTTSLLGLIALLGVSLGGQGIANRLPDSAAWVAWIIPPVFRIADTLFRLQELPVAHIAWTLLFAAAYAIVLAAAYIRVSRRLLF